MSQLPLDGQAILIEKVANEFTDYVDMGLDYCPNDNVYKVTSREEDLSVGILSRTAALKALRSDIIKKVSFDTRRINQETQRNPRTNLQYWHRAEEFIGSDDEQRLRIFARLMNILVGVKNDFGKEPEWFESYARVLHDNVRRILRVKQADLDIFKPQLSYLEQMLFTRYRLSMDDLSRLSEAKVRDIILSKDESLLKRGQYMRETGLFTESEKKDKVVIDGSKNSTQESIVNAIFGNNSIRREGEKTVERTITITIRDNVVD